MNQPEYRHWQLATDLDGIRWLTLDRAGEKINSLSREVLDELRSIVAGLEAEPPRGVVIQSGKKGSFVVGADIREFETITNPVEAANAIREVHSLFNRIESLPFPVVATVEGYCLGGGLELALACHYRVARNLDDTRLGFPEIQLGIYPGFGGSARTARLLGGPKALELMLSARNLHAGEALRRGLVDQIVGPHGELRWAARNAILKGRKGREGGLMARLSNSPPARKTLAGLIRKKTSVRANPEHYPAPFSLIEAWEEHGDDFDAMLEQEAVRVGTLIMTPTSRSLRRIFRLMEMLKSQGKESDFRARRVHVVGAGTMGGDIAAWCVTQGLEVTLQDRDIKYVQAAQNRAEQLFRRKLRTPDRIAGARTRLLPDVDGNGIERADIIIEAIFEDVGAKRELFRTIEARARPEAVLATNTSAIPLSDIAIVLQRPKRLIGLHFFNPVAKMPLVEVVHGEETEPGEVKRGAAFCHQIGRYPLPVRSRPGFLVNRVLTPYMLKALRIHRERGIPKEALDQAAVYFGMPMGPVELADTVGLDVGLSVMKTLAGDSAMDEVALLRGMVDHGKLGKKSGQGFYRWETGRPIKAKAASEGINLKSLADELMQPYFEECRACLADRIVDNADLLDAGMVFGTGFAPFRGGPMYYLEQSGSRQTSRTEVRHEQ